MFQFKVFQEVFFLPAMYNIYAGVSSLLVDTFVQSDITVHLL